MRLIDAGDRSRSAPSSGLVVVPADRMASSTRNWLVSGTDDRAIDFFLIEINETLRRPAAEVKRQSQGPQGSALVGSDSTRQGRFHRVLAALTTILRT